MKIKAVNGDYKNLVYRHHVRSDGMCQVTEIKINEDHSITKGDTYNIHKLHLETPRFLMPRPQRLKFIDPLDLMRRDSYPIATLQPAIKIHRQR